MILLLTFIAFFLIILGCAQVVYGSMPKAYGITMILSGSIIGYFLQGV